MEESERTARKTRNDILTSMMAGSAAGAVAKTVIAPLDRTKIYFQVHQEEKFNYARALRWMRRTAREEGVRALWRGNSATMARVVPYAAIQFTAHEQWKRVLGVDGVGRHGSEGPAAQGSATPFRRLLAGSLAGATGTIFTYPLDFARARLADTRKDYGSLFAVFRYVWRKRGVLGLYKGLSPTLQGSVVYAGCSFFTFETLKLERRRRNEGQPSTAVEKFLFGATAGALSQSCSYPLDIVRRRMQTGKAVEGLGTPGHLLHIYRQEGVIKGLYKGLSMNWLKGPIAVGISFSVYEAARKALRSHPHFSTPDT